MFWKILLCAVASGLVVLFLWSLRGTLLLPVRENGTLKGSIVIEDRGMDAETREMARLLARRWDCVSLGWDGEEWTNEKN